MDQFGAAWWHGIRESESSANQMSACTVAETPSFFCLSLSGVQLHRENSCMHGSLQWTKLMHTLGSCVLCTKFEIGGSIACNDLNKTLAKISQNSLSNDFQNASKTLCLGVFSPSPKKPKIFPWGKKKTLPREAKFGLKATKHVLTDVLGSSTLRGTFWSTLRGTLRGTLRSTLRGTLRVTLRARYGAHYGVHFGDLWGRHVQGQHVRLMLVHRPTLI